jgi:hypothetical protein
MLAKAVEEQWLSSGQKNGRHLVDVHCRLPTENTQYRKQSKKEFMFLKFPYK